MGPSEVQGLFIIYGVGWVAVFSVLTALHARAWWMREDLALDGPGRRELRQSLAVFSAIASVGVLSMLAVGLGLGWGLPGWLYLLAPTAAPAQRFLTTERRRKLRESIRGRRKPPS